MATADFPRRAGEREAGDEVARTRPLAGSRADATALGAVLTVLASLKLTVVLLSMLTFLVFAGTLAQVHHDVWYVVRHGYFRVWFAFIEFQTLPALLGVFRPNEYVLPGGFYFPGGYLIGTVMAVNLLTAHGLRFKISARGGRLAGGLALLVLGALATAWVILRALDVAHEASITPEFSDLLWNLLRGGLAGVALAGAYLLSLAWRRIRWPEWWTLAALDAVALGTAAWLFLNPQWQISDSAMRIVWQLVQATLAGGLLLASCWLLFAKRAGVVLLHTGIALLMLHELYTGVTAVEANMVIEEGETVNYVFDNRESELAIIDRLNPAEDRVTVIPNALLARAAAKPADAPERVIRHPDLPVDVRVHDFHVNTDIRAAGDQHRAVATVGAGTQLAAVEAKKVSGVGGAIDIPAAYVELLDKNSGESHGTLLVTNFFDPWVMGRVPPRAIMPGMPVATGGEQRLEVDGRPLAVAMRFKRIYKPYSVTLLDFNHDVYMGTNTPKNFSSDVRLVDPRFDTDLTYKIWMNNPLRYRGETFYQADWNKVTGTGTVLQVVKNESWMLPYIGCAVVLLGMVVHFGFTLVRFLDRRTREAAQTTPATITGSDADRQPLLEWLVQPAVLLPAVVALLTAGYLASKTRSPEVVVDGMPVHEFAAMPVVNEGRVKPYDTMARNLLQFLCERQEAPVDVEGDERIPAAQWLLDVASGRPGAENYYVFRITNLELIESLGLPRRPGFFRYNFAEIDQQVENLFKQVQATENIDSKDLTPYQRQVQQLWLKRELYVSLANSFGSPQFGGPETIERDFVTAYMQAMRLRAPRVPRSVPPASLDGEWMNLYEAELREHCVMLREALGDRMGQVMPTVRQVILELGDQRPGAAATPLAMLVAAYRAGDEQAFSRAMDDYKLAIAEYEAQLADPANAGLVADLKPAERLAMDKVRFEQRFNAASPFYYCYVFYLIALVLSAAAWLVWPKTLGRTATAIIVVTLVVHTLALAARVYISGRPPITNLYTTAVFNGWAIMVFVMVLESIYKLGIGNFIASAVGLTTLVIAHNLALDEDTFTVLQAVLDTQFWLFTHVITINLGYATTMLAGFIGIVYIVLVHFLNVLDKRAEQALARMIYGTLCFAILFSFVGTVLGGLWADDSWGRFWGWDPKENGAFMIVLWNAIALHARWGKMVTTRGLAMLAIFGNVITAWSWFGVNQLGQGLHNYGFNDGLARYLLVFFISQMALLAIGAVPWGRLFRSAPAAA